MQGILKTFQKILNVLRKALNTFISRIKNESYVIDERIPTGYLVRQVRVRVFMKLRGLLRFPGRPNPPFVGSGAVILCKSKVSMGRGVSIGEKAFIDALSTDGVRFGDNVSVGRNTRIECTGNLRHLGKGLIVGDDVGLGTDNFFGCAGGIEIGSDTIIGNFVSFHAENHNSSQLDVPIRLQGVNHRGIRIGKNCWIGAKCTILDGTVIEDGCIIAAGTVVRDNVYKKNGIYGGVPAKLIKYRADEG
jgi:acetyltransferase-like isoleucine patch superfamily enzyme